MENQLQKAVWKISLIIAPLLVAISQFYWSNGVLGETAGVVQIYGFVFWVIAYQGMFEQLRPQYPRYATFGFMIAVLACVGGCFFGFEGLYNEALGISDTAAAGDLHAKFGTGRVVALLIPGVSNPLSWLVMAVMLWKAGKTLWWQSCIFGFAAILFPMSRIPRIPWLAHVDNALMLIAMCLISYQLFGGRNKD